MTSDVQEQHGRQRRQLCRDGVTMSAAETCDMDYCNSAVDASSSRVLQHRQWVRVDSNHRSTTRDSASRFRVATYNILTDNAIHPGQYLYCPTQLRYMASRHERIVAEISQMQPDVVCLQVCRNQSQIESLLVSNKILCNSAHVLSLAPKLFNKHLQSPYPLMINFLLTKLRS